jgi:thiol-disulfide isomerase/thioredoxin
VARRARRSVLRARAVGALGVALCLLGAAPPAPLEVEGPGGEPVALAPREGRALVVHFWATWCPSCVEEVPDLVRAAAGCAGAVDVALVDVGEEWDEVRRFAAEHAIAAPMLRDPDGAVWRKRAGGWGLPANLLWTGDAQRSEVGSKSPAQWRETLARLGCAQSAAAGR